MARGYDGDVTASFIEKAFASIYGGYQTLTMGHNVDSFRDLTGATTEYVPIDDLASCSRMLTEAYEKGFFLAISFKTTVKEPFQPSHSYALLNVIDKGDLFLKLENPNGCTCLACQLGLSGITNQPRTW